MSSTEAGGGGGIAARAQLSFERLVSKNVLIVAAALAAAVVLAWAWLAGPGQSMGAMEHAGMPGMAGMQGTQVEPWSAEYLLPAFTMWALMMVAMMLPSAAPMILLHARIDRAPTPGRRLLHSGLFALCYLAAWAAFSAVAALAQAVMIDVGLVDAGSLALGGPGVAAAVLGAAALYQLTAAKAACLDQCRSPLLFVLRYWRPGSAGAVRLGVVHGIHCVGCCWALMLLLFVGGVMNLAWVAFLGLLVLAEKVAPPSWRLSRLAAAGLAIAAIGVLLRG